VLSDKRAWYIVPGGQNEKHARPWRSTKRVALPKIIAVSPNPKVAFRLRTTMMMEL